jgi:hypothetical protein
LKIFTRQKIEAFERLKRTINHQLSKASAWRNQPTHPNHSIKEQHHSLLFLVSLLIHLFTKKFKYKLKVKYM